MVVVVRFIHDEGEQAVPTVFDTERIKRMREMERQGINRSEIARREGTTRQRIFQLLGPLVEDRGQRKDHVVYVVEESWRGAMEVAASLDLYIRSGPTAGQGSVALLIEKIGNGDIIVANRTDGGKLKKRRRRKPVDTCQESPPQRSGGGNHRDSSTSADGVPGSAEAPGALSHADTTG